MVDFSHSHVTVKVGGVTKAPAQPHPASVVQIPEVEIFFLVSVASVAFQWK